MAATRVVTNALGRALRETGQALDRVGLTVSGTEIFRETFSRHRPIMNLFDKVRITSSLPLGLCVALSVDTAEEFIRSSLFPSLSSWQRPLVANGVFVAPSASVVGQVLLYGNSSVSECHEVLNRMLPHALI